MNKIIISLLISLFCLQIVSAQINLEHTFNSVGFGTWHFNTETETFYYNANVNTNKVFVYNNDYSLYKTINFIPPSGYQLYWVYYPSKHLFNDDDLIEFILVFTNSTNYQMKVYNENMSMVKDLGAGNNAYVFISQESGYKLKTTNWVYNTGTQNLDYTDKVYSLPGELYVSNEQVDQPKINQSAYPNPASNRIILPYKLKPDEISTLHIYNLQGQIIESKTIHGSLDHLRIDVSNYFPGTYLYEYKGFVSSFVVN